MNNPLSQKLEGISLQLGDIFDQLREIMPQFEKYSIDWQALARIKTDLSWAAENTRVVSRHLIGKSLQDNMGYSVPTPEQIEKIEKFKLSLHQLLRRPQ